ncbi:hypothetical protein L3Q82_008893 [Scortum barcoo]|uniref:Uncharacterized protein n=1 Tax=Scortum barcoo TaxID=214431 RepID=A0ACB8XCT1_9TELE|nr:hypothetical protein L3Q82_008893 [Scortum barcoo]
MGTTESTEDLFRTLQDWCLRNNLQINAGKTKELVVDFRRRSHSPPAPVSIQGTDIDTVKSSMSHQQYRQSAELHYKLSRPSE